MVQVNRSTWGDRRCILGENETLGSFPLAQNMQHIKIITHMKLRIYMHNDVDAQFETLICTCSADVDAHVLHAVYTV